MSTKGKIEFIQFREPALEDGDYAITVTQTIESSDRITKTTFPNSDAPPQLLFSVAGPRFSLSPQEIHAVFPPDGSLGDHSNVLPHIVLNRSTLPWERAAFEGQSPPCPWLALLLFDDDEKPTPQVVPLGSLRVEKNYPALSGMKAELSQHDDDKVTVIDVPKDLLKQIAPTELDLVWLAHARQATDEARNLIGDELAVIICNRLPQQFGTSTVHLVSVEKRYGENGFDLEGAGDTVRLVSLKSWSFSCLDEKQSFLGLLKHLHSSTLRLPLNKDPVAESFLAGGFVPLPHFIREGSKSVSWYHGPLMPGPISTEIELPVRAADQLVRYDTTTGMFDVSYGSAWELGRLLALQSNHFSLSLFNWKRQHAHELRKAEQLALHPHLPSHATKPPPDGKLDVPESINKWFWDLSLLKGLPFNYLVPDELMLPAESIRFFQLDPLWIECLLDGAFSIGRVSDVEHSRDASHEQSPAANPHGSISGILLRSSVVSGWPGLLVDASSEAISSDKPMSDEKKLELLRMDRLSPNVLICLFDGEIKTVDIHQKPETLHFGLNPTTQPPGFEKILRDSDGNEQDQNKIPVPWKPNENRDKLVVDISQFASSFKYDELGFHEFTSAEFALEMIEGAESVRFCQSNPSSEGRKPPRP